VALLASAGIDKIIEMGIINQYIIQPILQDSGYNPINTLAWAVLAIAALYGVYRFLKWQDLPADINLFYAAFPFIVFGAMTRAFVDHNYYVMTPLKKFLLITPGIWLLSFAFALLALEVALRLRTRFNIYKTMGLLGSLLVVTQIGLNLNKLAFRRGSGALLILAIFIGLCIAIYFLSKKLAAYRGVGRAAVLGQLCDATNTSVILSLYGGTEKHFIPRWIIGRFGPWSFFAIKILLVLPAVYLLWAKVKDELLRNTFLLGIAILGTGEGLRNFISMILL